jgi:alcohol dehydrogenase, propanol-preferring
MFIVFTVYNIIISCDTEVAGWVGEVGDSVPQGILDKGDLVAIFGGWGCGVCIHCKGGDEQLCNEYTPPGLS